MKRLITLITAIMLVPFFVQAQDLADALRYSEFQVQGTARAGAMGNAFGALGGDFTSLSINPAGIGLYQRGELVISPSYNFNYTELSFNDNSYKDNKPFFNLNNIGIIGTNKNISNEVGLVSINYGIGFNKLSNFNYNSFAKNEASSESFLDGIVNYTNDEALSIDYLNQNIRDIEYRDWYSKLAWDTYLIDPMKDNQGNDIDGNYVNILYEDEKVNQNKTSKTEGNINEYLFNLGVNFNHKFYIGAMLGLHDISFKKYSIYEEILANDESFSFGDELLINGHGFNLKIGAIYKPINNIRLGIAFHSPTYYQIAEESVLSMDSYLAESYSSYGINEYDYDFYTPLKAILSGALVFNKIGLLSIDAEYQNYSNMRFRSSKDRMDNFSDLNENIGNTFEDIINIRIGGEFRLSRNLSLRGGYELYGNPYSSDPEFETVLSDNMNTWSAGLGYAVNNFFADVAYRKSTTYYNQYNDQVNFENIQEKNTKNKVLFTFGFKF